MKRDRQKCLSHRKGRSSVPAFLFSQATKTCEVDEDNGVVSYALACGIAPGGG
jgi:hypothetical protein